MKNYSKKDVRVYVAEKGGGGGGGGGGGPLLTLRYQIIMIA